MSTTFEMLRIGADYNLQHAEALYADIAAEQMTTQPGVVNHPAWTLARLLHYQPSIFSLIRGEAVDDPGHHPDASTYDAGSTPTADPTVYPSKDALLERFRANHRVIAASLQHAQPDVLSAPPGLARWVTPFETILHALIYLLVFHEAEHLGQVAAWRRAMGMPPAA